MHGPRRERARFETFQVDLTTGELFRSGIRIPVQDKPFQLLRLLLEAGGKPVGREQIRQTLWPADTFVDFEHAVNTAIKKLRHALDDSADQPRFIETLPKIGYRFIAPIEWEDQDRHAVLSAAGLPITVAPPADATGSPTAASTAVPWRLAARDRWSRRSDPRGTCCLLRPDAIAAALRFAARAAIHHVPRLRDRAELLTRRQQHRVFVVRLREGVQLRPLCQAGRPGACAAAHAPSRHRFSDRRGHPTGG